MMVREESFSKVKFAQHLNSMSGEDGIQGNEFRMLMSRMMLFTEQLPIPHNLIVSSPTWVSQPNPVSNYKTLFSLEYIK